MEGQVKRFLDEKNLKGFIITKPLLYRMLKGLIEGKEDQNMNNKMAKEKKLCKCAFLDFRGFPWN